jgi:hypothetical protein
LDLDSETRQPSDLQRIARGLSLREQQRRNPDERRSHRDSSHREIGILEVEKIETLQVSKYRRDLDRPLVETRGGDRSIGSRDIDIPVDKRSGKSI